MIQAKSAKLASPNTAATSGKLTAEDKAAVGPQVPQSAGPAERRPVAAGYGTGSADQNLASRWRQSAWARGTKPAHRACAACLVLHDARRWRLDDQAGLAQPGPLASVGRERSGVQVLALARLASAAARNVGMPAIAALCTACRVSRAPPHALMSPTAALQLLRWLPVAGQQRATHEAGGQQVKAAAVNCSRAYAK